MTHHEVAGGGGNLERDAHRLVHGDHLERSRANAEESGETPCHKHQAESGGDAAHVIALDTLGGGIGGAHLQQLPQTVWGTVGAHLGRRASRSVGGEKEDDSENDTYCGGREPGGDGSSHHRTHRRGDFQKHPDADVGKSLLDIGGCRPRRSGNNRNQGGADGITDINSK